MNEAEAKAISTMVGQVVGAQVVPLISDLAAAVDELRVALSVMAQRSGDPAGIADAYQKVSVVVARAQELTPETAKAREGARQRLAVSIRGQ